jgi:hypothetical protein
VSHVGCTVHRVHQPTALSILVSVPIAPGRCPHPTNPAYSSPPSQTPRPRPRPRRRRGKKWGKRKPNQPRDPRLLYKLLYPPTRSPAALQQELLLPPNLWDSSGAFFVGSAAADLTPRRRVLLRSVVVPASSLLAVTFFYFSFEFLFCFQFCRVLTSCFGGTEMRRW